MEKESIINLGEEKSVFERAIIEAFKEKTSKLMYEKLTIALDEIKYIVADIKKYNSNNSEDDIIIEDISGNTDIEKKIEISKDKPKKNLPQKYILNKNILDKLSRITERKLFNVNNLISRIYDSLLESENFSILSNDFNFLINFSNEILNLLDLTKSTLAAPKLNLKCYNFLQFLIKSEKVSNEQNEQIKEIIANFPFRNSSETFKNVNIYNKF